MYVYIGGNRLPVAVAESAAAERLIDLLCAGSGEESVRLSLE